MNSCATSGCQSGCSESYQTPSLSCGTGRGHARLTSNSHERLHYLLYLEPTKVRPTLAPPIYDAWNRIVGMGPSTKNNFRLYTWTVIIHAHTQDRTAANSLTSRFGPGWTVLVSFQQLDAYAFRNYFLHVKLSHCQPTTSNLWQNIHEAKVIVKAVSGIV